MPAPSPILQFKRGSATTVSSGVATFRAGEPGFTTDKYDFYIGSNNTASGNKFFGSARYWSREDATNSAQIRLVDKDGSNYIAIAASNTLAGVATYRFPNTSNGSTGDFLKVKSVAGGYYDLEWSAVPSGSFTITGDTGTDTFTTGETLTFAGTTAEIETSITNNQVKIGLPDNVTITGVITATTFSGNASSATYASTAGIATYAATAGIATYAGTAGIATNATNATYATSAGIATYAGTAGIATYAGTAGIATYASTTGVSTYATSAGIATYAGTAGIATYATNAGISTQVKTVTAGDLAATHYITFVDSHNGTSTAETVYTDDGIYYNPGTNTFTTQHAVFTGIATVQTSFKVGTGVGVTQFTSAVSSGTTTSSVPTSSAVIDYVQSQVTSVDLTLGLNADSGGPSTVNTSQTLTISGTTNQVQTAVSGQTVTISLPTNVIVGTSVSAPTIKTAAIQHSNGTAAINIDSTGNVTSLKNLTVSGDLFVNGNTTEVNTTALNVYDRTITLGVQTGSTPTTTTWDLGILMNYGDAGTAKTAGMIWDYDIQRFVFAANSPNPSSGGNSTTPDIDILTANFAPIEIKSLYVNNACSNTAGSVEVIGCRDSGSGSELQLMNIVVDGGAF